MSSDGFALSVTLKAGKDFDSPWVVVYGNAPDEVQGKLETITAGGLLQATVDAANALKAANNAAPLLPQGQEAQPQPAAPQQQPWGQQPQQQAPQQAAPQQQGGNRFGGPTHPEGKTCDICPKVLEEKKTSTGKLTWRCPDWRWNNGNQNGHTNIFR